MSETPESLILHLLRAIQTDVSELKADMQEVNERLGSLDAQYASVSRRVDRMGGDIERIKMRLSLHDETIPS